MVSAALEALERVQALLEVLGVNFKGQVVAVLRVMLLEQWQEELVALGAQELVEEAVVRHGLALTLALVVLAVTASVAFTVGKDSHDAFCDT